MDTGAVEYSFEARSLRRAWSLRLRSRANIEQALLSEIEDCLFSLERLGRGAFNVFPAHYEPLPPQPVIDAVARLRMIGATSGLSNGTGQAVVRLQIEPAPMLI